MDTDLSEALFRRRMTKLGRSDGLLLEGILGVDFFSTSELLYGNMKLSLRVIKSRFNFHNIRDSSNKSHGIVDFSLNTHCIALKDDYHNRRIDMPVHTPMEFKLLETLAITFMITPGQYRFIQENIVSNAPVNWIA